MNCVQCHQPGGPGATTWDARPWLTLDQTHLINGQPADNGNNPVNKLIVPGDTAHSVVLQRILGNGFGRMPPLATHQLDLGASNLLTAWISAELTNRQTFADWQLAYFGSTNAPNAAATADPDGDLRIALDEIASHPNVGPFISRQLIQRLVTSNPTPAYVARVAQAFGAGRFTSGLWSTGTGQRGDLRATVAAILLDSEARTAVRLADPTFGKVREPILRGAHWMRAFNARSASGNFLLGVTDDATTSLGQSAMRSPTVFNFYRPGYVPPNTSIATAGLVAPELQIVNEVSVVGYSNFMLSAVQNGLGSGSPRDIQPDYTAELALADNADLLIDRVSLLLTAGSMSAATRTIIRDAVNSVAMPATNQTTARQNRVRLAVFFTLSSPDYLAQK